MIKNGEYSLDIIDGIFDTLYEQEEKRRIELMKIEKRINIFQEISYKVIPLILKFDYDSLWGYNVIGVYDSSYNLLLTEKEFNEMDVIDDEKMLIIGGVVYHIIEVSEITFDKNDKKWFGYVACLDDETYQNIKENYEKLFY